MAPVRGEQWVKILSKRPRRSPMCRRLRARGRPDRGGGLHSGDRGHKPASSDAQCRSLSGAHDQALPIQREGRGAWHLAAGGRDGASLSLRGGERAPDHGQEAIGSQELGPQADEAALAEARVSRRRAGSPSPWDESGKIKAISTPCLRDGTRAIEEEQDRKIVVIGLRGRPGWTGEHRTCWLPVGSFRCV
jgi:hypothetical protein